MKKPVIVMRGKKVDLAVLDKELHKDSCLIWVNDPEITKFTLSGPPIMEPREDDWFEKTAKSENNIVFAIYTKDGKYIGNAGLHKIDRKHQRAEGGIMIGDKTEWGKGYASEAESMLIEFAFMNENLNKVEARIITDNIGSQKAASKNGSQIEGVLRQHIYKNGRWNDCLIVSILKEDWLKLKGLA